MYDPHLLYLRISFALLCLCAPADKLIRTNIVAPEKYQYIILGERERKDNSHSQEGSRRERTFRQPMDSGDFQRIGRSPICIKPTPPGHHPKPLTSRMSDALAQSHRSIEAEA